MTPDTPNPASAAAPTGNGGVCFGSERLPDSPARPIRKRKNPAAAERGKSSKTQSFPVPKSAVKTAAPASTQGSRSPGHSAKTQPRT
jgi:hypothetical protein